MPLRTFRVDAFAERLFEGNPAAVCVLEDDLHPDGRGRAARQRRSR